MADDTKESAPFGRPTEFKQEYIEQAVKLCELGATDDEIANFFNVHRSTIYRWKLEYPDFCDAIKSAKENADERVERSLYQKATGYNVKQEQAIKVKLEQHREGVEVVEVETHVPADTTAAIFWLKNRRKDQWRDKQDVQLTGANGGPIETVNTLDASRLSTSALQEIIKASRNEADKG